MRDLLIAEDAAADPFLETMFSRMSPGARFLFNDRQLDEIKRAFAARSFTSHAVDRRVSFRALGMSYYVLFLAGRERTPRALTDVRGRGRWATAFAMSAAALSCGIMLLNFV